MLQPLRNTNTVAPICNVLSYDYGDSVARLTVIQGMTLADLIGSLLRSLRRMAKRSN